MTKELPEITLEYAWDAFDDVLRLHGLSDEQISEFNLLCVRTGVYSKVVNNLVTVGDRND